MLPPLAAPLSSDPARQAPDLFRGCRFQIWRSVEAWLDLGDDEALALEGGEDFDRLASGSATATQVKDLSHNLTLRSEEVVEAIGNFWDLRTKNPEIRLRFRFLTTAKAGVEKGNPFGKDVPGLEVWGKAAKSGAEIQPLREFLLKDGKISSPVQEFLEGASDEKVRRELLEPLEWALEQGKAAYVEEWVRRRLILHGEKQGIPAHDADRVAEALYTEASEATSRKSDRILRRSDFLRIFDEKTAKRINPAEALLAAREHGLIPSMPPGSLISPHAYSPRRWDHWTRNTRLLVPLFLMVSLAVFLLYDQLARPMENLTLISPLVAWLYLAFVATIGSPVILFSLLQNGVRVLELPLLATAAVNTVLLVLLARNALSWTYHRILRRRISR